MRIRRSMAILSLLALTLVPTGSLPAQDRAGGGEQLGQVHFPVSCSPTAQVQFDRSVALLHSFWFQPATLGFEAVAQTDPTCGMAYWGLAMAAMGNPLAGAPMPSALKEGAVAAEKARVTGARTPRERDYIAAVGAFYKDADRVEHRLRAAAYEQAMGRLAQAHPQDSEAQVFHALALNMTLSPTDKTYGNQLRAAAILEKIFAAQPKHPGVAHYLIHSYDFPPIASRGVDAARRYAGIAPSAPHALHMPSHIFTRLGHWEESIESNRRSAEAAKGEVAITHPGAGSYNALHAMDYMAYGYLQLARDSEAAAVLDQMKTYKVVDVEHFAAAFAFAAIPARVALERLRWKDAAGLALHPPQLSWQKFPQAEAITVFARALGAARSGDPAAARRDVTRLEALRDALAQAKNAYWAGQVDVQIKGALGWVAHAEGKPEEAVRLLREAADLEDASEKHPVTPGALFPAREMLGQLLIQLGQPAAALREFEASQKVEPNRFLGLHGAAHAAELAGDAAKARAYYARLVTLAAKGEERPEVRQARAYLARR
jgi:tetratricopeptide (TPR) repeat protein